MSYTRVKMFIFIRCGAVAEMTQVASLTSVVLLLLILEANFSIGVRNNTDHEPLQPIREAFSFRFWS